MSAPLPCGLGAVDPMPTAGPAEVVVWRVALDAPSLPAAFAQRVLSPAERERAAAFRTRRLRDRYVVAHAALRWILGRRLRMPPEAVVFAFQERGKPVLAARHGPAPPHFSLSHADDTALIAVCDATPVGVDLEPWRIGVAVDDVAAECLCAGEVEALRTLSGSERERAFLTGWVRKEAFVKATGAGLAMPLDRVQVSMLPGDPPRLVSIDGDPEAASAWSVVDLGTADFAAALVVRRPGLRGATKQKTDTRSLVHRRPPVALAGGKDLAGERLTLLGFVHPGPETAKLCDLDIQGVSRGGARCRVPARAS